MGAIKLQSGLGGPDEFTARYGGVPVVFVESEEDLFVYGECWFVEQLSKIEFRSARTRINSDGCSAVRGAVEQERLAGIPAWGIVDRDTIMSDDQWHLVHETDDAIYDRAEPFGKNVKVLRRWELESYLIDAVALEYIVSSLQKRRIRNSSSVNQELVDNCLILVPHAAANAVFHDRKINGLGDGYTNRFADPAAVDADIRAMLKHRIPTEGLPSYNSHLHQVAAFDLPAATSELRLLSLLRRIHGKALLERFLHASHNIQADVKGLLARKIKENASVPGEIKAFVQSVIANPN